MTTTVSIQISSVTFAKLKKLAVLAGSVPSAIERLIEYWELRETPTAQDLDKVKPVTWPTRMESWRTPNGDELPIGAPLFAPYAGKTYEAVVVKGGISFEGVLYDNPTKAGRAVKKIARGLDGRAASTNGREFWRLRDPSTGQLVSIKDLNPGPQIDANELLRELMEETKLKPNRVAHSR